MNFSVLLPADTRAVELVSAFALLLTSIFLFFGAPASAWMLGIHAREFWVVLLASFGAMQLIGIIKNTYSAQALRAIVTWMAGMFWVWLSFEYMLDAVRPTEVLSLILGVSNFYAFIINLNLLVRGKWN